MKNELSSEPVMLKVSTEKNQSDVHPFNKTNDNNDTQENEGPDRSPIFNY